MSERENTQLVLNAIATLRTELSDRMNRQDEQREKQWTAIGSLTSRVCPMERHTDIETRVRSLEFDRAKFLGIAVAVATVAGLIGWGIERILK